MFSDITDICMVFLQYGFSCGFSDYNADQMISDITGTCMVFRQDGFSYGFSVYNPDQLTSNLSGTSIVFLQCGFSYSPSDHLITNFTVFLKYEFFDELCIRSLK